MSDKPSDSSEINVDGISLDNSHDDLGEALKEAAIQESKGKGPKKGKAKKKRKSKGKGKLASFSKVDWAIATVLLANLLMMLVLGIVPIPGTGPQDLTKKPTDERLRSGKKGTRSTLPPSILKRIQEMKGGVLPEEKKPPVPRSRYWEEAWKESEKGNLSQAILYLERLLKEEPNMEEAVRRTVQLQLSHFCGLAGRFDEMRRYLALAQKGTMKALGPTDLWRLAEEAYAVRDYQESRRYLARFLLQQNQMPKHLKEKIPLAYLRLADGYRNEAREVPEKKEGDK
jgi:hypothetical protein